MQIFKNISDWTDFRRAFAPSLTLGFVPTMGNLHAGHASLFAKSIQENDCTVASLFVNPTQFNQPDDFSNYPRTLEADCELLEKTGVDFCILPSEQDMYPDQYRYKLEEHELSLIMEGKQRPGHFNGVLTVILKLLNLVKANNAYFGEKDYQQYLLIRGLAEAFFIDTHIKPCPTIRESSGLAYSSRNNRLNAEQRLLAETFARIFHQGKSCELITKDLQAAGITVEYIVDYEGGRFAAVVIGNIRLIDNISLAR